MEATSAESVRLVKSQAPILVSLVKGCATMNVLQKGEQVPHGCALKNISEEYNVHLMVKVNILLQMISYDVNFPLL